MFAFLKSPVPGTVGLILIVTYRQQFTFQEFHLYAFVSRDHFVTIPPRIIELPDRAAQEPCAGLYFN